MPDLILLDGGQGQLSAAKEILFEFSLNIPMFGMVKDSKHKTRAIAADGGDIVIKSNRRAYTLVSTIQEETHRFAITYHKTRSKKTALRSRLLEIEGVGKTFSAHKRACRKPHADMLRYAQRTIRTLAYGYTNCYTA